MNPLIPAQAAFPPHSFNELHTEHTYLLSTLQQQNLSATEILRKIPFLEEKLNQDHPPAVRRRARKQISWFKHRLDEFTRQEQTILARLGQITYEIQFRERISQLEHERWTTWLNNINAPQAQLQGPTAQDYWNGGQGRNDTQQPFPSLISPGFVELSQYPPQLYIPSPISPSCFPSPTATTQRTMQLSPLSPCFEPSGIFRPDFPYIMTPWQHWPALASTSLNWMIQQEEVQEQTPYLSIGIEIQRPRSSRGVSPTQINRRSSGSKSDRNGAMERGISSGPISLSISTGMDTDPTEACDNFHPAPPLESPSSRRGSNLAVPAPKRRPVSMDYAALLSARKEGGREDGEELDGPGSGPKRHSLPNIWIMGGMRESSPVL